MIRLLCALTFLFQSSAYATVRNFGIVDSPRYEHMKGKKNKPSAKKAFSYDPAPYSLPLAGSTTSRKKSEKYYLKAKVLTLDTRDTATCEIYAQTLTNEGTLTRREGRDLCDIDLQNPYVSIVVEDKSPRARGYKYSELSTREQKLATQTRNFIVPAAGMMALLFALPKSFTGWESFDSKGLGQKWKDNVKAGPVMDHDKWAVNYIGHPYAGAAYYVIARHAGFSQLESFGYSAFMSTFFWEYGIESFAEIPSIQDLIVTPLLGSLMGEVFLQGEKLVRANNNKVLGSKFLGSTALFLFNPAGGVLEATDKLFERSPFVDAEFKITPDFSSPKGDTRVGFNLVLWIKKK